MEVLSFDTEKGIYIFNMSEISTELHSHPAIEIVIAMEGSFSISIPNQTVENATLAIVNCNVIHKLVASAADKIKVLMFEHREQSILEALATNNIYLENGFYVATHGIATDKHGLKIVYDAAHAFAADYHGTSILNYGDISTLSFHATKLFHTIEGGAIVTNDDELAYRINYMRNFGHNGPTDFVGCGINAKSSEFNAAMGLCLLPKVKDLVAKRKYIFERYNELLAGLPLKPLEVREGTSYNYAYYPIEFTDEAKLLQVLQALEQKGIVTRRYFYPSLNKLNYVAYEPCPVSEDVATRMLCLPFYPQLTDAEQELIVEIVRAQF